MCSILCVLFYITVSVSGDKLPLYWCGLQYVFSHLEKILNYSITRTQNEFGKFLITLFNGKLDTIEKRLLQGTDNDVINRQYLNFIPRIFIQPWLGSL